MIPSRTGAAGGTDDADGEAAVEVPGVVGTVAPGDAAPLVVGPVDVPGPRLPGASVGGSAVASVADD